MTEMPAGASGFFSAPSETLDPNLFFSGDELREEVRQCVTGNFLAWMTHSGWRIHPDWTHLWLTGSGVSYQWAADRGNGDLDVMVSIDVVPFRDANPEVQGWGEDDIAQYLTMKWQADLWPRMANTQIGERTYEVTYYWNSGTGQDIRHIGPYAAVNVKNGKWIVRPPKLPQDPSSLYPTEWFDVTQADHDAASGLFQEYGRRMAETLSPSPAARVNADAALKRLAAEARALYDDIHLGRHGAFGPQGTGYGDFRNFRHQRAKQLGVYDALRLLIKPAEEVQADEETRLYGQPILPADRAALQSARWRSRG